MRSVALAMVVLLASGHALARALVVVESEQSTLKAGDRIDGVTLHDTQSELSDAIQFYATAIRDGSEADVTLHGFRDGVRQSWTVPGGRWGIVVAPAVADQTHSALLTDWLKADASNSDEDAIASVRALWRDQGNWTNLAWLTIELTRRQAQTGAWEAALQTVAAFEQAVMPKLDPASLAATWSQLAEVFERYQDPALTRDYYQQAIALWAQAGSPVLQAHGLERLGGFDARHGQLATAAGHLDQSLALLKTAAPTSLIAVRAWNGKGTVAYAGGDYALAVSNYQQALDLLERRGGPLDEMASPLGNLGTLAAIQGDLSKAQELYDAALKIKQRKPDDPVIPRLLNNLGIIAKQRGDLLAAEGYYQQALEINRERQSWVSYSTNLFNLADLASDQGDLAGASQLLRQALEHFQQQNSRSPAVAQTLGELAGIELKLGNPQQSRSLYEQAAALYQEVAPESVDYAFILEGLGDVARRQGDLPTAVSSYEQAIAWRKPIAPQSIHIAHAMTALAQAQNAAGQAPAARRLLDDALAIQAAVAPGSIAQAQSLFALAELQSAGRTPADALESYEAGITMVEYQTQRLGGADDSRSRFNDQYAGYFKRYIEQLVAMEHFDQAFNVLERYRARSLLALLAERDLNWRQDLPAQLQLERRQLDRDYDDAQSALLDLAEQRATEAQMQTAREALADLKRRRDAFAAKLRVSSPHFANLTYPQPLKLDDVQRQLPADTIVLSYSIHEAASWVFVVTTDSMELVPLRVGSAALATQVERFRSLIALGQYESAVSPALVELGQGLFDLLVRPAVGDVAGKRLLLVPDGSLHLLPFAALMDSQSPSPISGESWRYLTEISPIRSVLSLTLYQLLSAPRAPDSPPSQAVRMVAFGDPELDHHVAADEAGAVVTRGRTDLSRLPPLPGAREEVKALAKLYSPNVQTYVGSQATEASAKAVAGRIEYLHFATHSVLNESTPLDSGLVLSATATVGEDQENGLLQTWEIFEDMRIDTDLVVLSGCETSLGKAFGGEGLVGLTRAFHHAGSKAVMASLWQIADQSAAELMTLFHEHRLAGSRADEALHRAQLDLIAEANEGWFKRTWRSLTDRSAYAHPFHWASLQLHGADL